MILGAVLISTGRRAHADDRNSCGCYKDGAGVCYCDKKAKCGCPGECEPKGCEEQRERALQKEIDAETKKAASSQKKPASAASDEGGEERAKTDEPPAPRPASRSKLSAAQTKQLAKLLDLFLADHPDARGRSVEDVRADLSP